MQIAVSEHTINYQMAVAERLKNKQMVKDKRSISIEEAVTHLAIYLDNIVVDLADIVTTKVREEILLSVGVKFCVFQPRSDPINTRAQFE